MIEKATLIKCKKYWQVCLKTKKGSDNYTILKAVQYFREEDAYEGAEVNVIREKGQLTKVTIEGKPEIKPQPQFPKKREGGNMAKHHPHNRNAKRTNKMQQASPEVLEGAFHNPYTFIPFTEKPVADCIAHTALSADDETEKNYLTGIIKLEVETLSPLMTHDAGTENEHGHKSYQMLKIGKNVVVPATAIKGFLRNLTTILSGGPVNNVDENAFLCQARDCRLKGKDGKPPLLARVKTPGDVFRDGMIQLGDSEFISTLALACYQDSITGGKKTKELNELKEKIQEYEELKAKKATSELKRIRYDCGPKFKNIVETLIRDLREKTVPIWVLFENNEVKRIDCGKCPSPEYWQLKISGPPINAFNKKEALFKPNGRQLTIPSALWAEYAYRNMHGDKIKLNQYDLVWLQVRENGDTLDHASQVLSLQWARWGKKGDRMTDRIRQEHVKPEWLSQMEKIHPVTNIFGIGSPKDVSKGSRGLLVSSKLRFGNLVFNKNVNILPCQPMAVLSSPQPGCLAFYRDSEDPRSVSSEDGLRGYKVYRTTKKDGQDGPWIYENQPVYQDGGKKIHEAETKEFIFSTELLAPNAKGELEIAFRSLSRDELSLLMAACKVPWRLGGGKPLGLGVCRVTDSRVFDEFGKIITYDDSEACPLVNDTQRAYWIKSQEPLDDMKYPRAVITNNKGKTLRGGHNWFSKMAKPQTKQKKKQDSDGLDSFEGLMPIYSAVELKQKADINIETHDGKNEHQHGEVTPISGSVLPKFNLNAPSENLLYGYDIHFKDNERQKQKFNNKTQNCYTELTKFSEKIPYGRPRPMD